MGQVYDELNETQIEFIGRQHLFFVGTAPDESDGHLNVSPKGLDSFRVLGPRSVAYLDLTGSGIETVAHLRQNGRITLMFCAFEGRPLILRLYGRGRVVVRQDPEWADLIGRFPDYPGIRSIIVVAVERIADACGWAVPVLEYRGERSQLLDFAERKGPMGLAQYRARANRTSIDGILGLESPGPREALMPVAIVDATDEASLDRVRILLNQFAAEYAPLVAEIFVVQGFAAEVAGLPGRYGPPSGCLLLATVDAEPSGCVALRNLGDGTCEMKRLYVAPPGRGRGVGRALVAALLDRATQLGYRRMVLDTLPEMAEAIALYHAFGFKPTEPYWGHPADHAVFLARSLVEDA